MSHDSKVEVNPGVAQAAATLVATLFRKDPPWDPGEDGDTIQKILKETHIEFYHAEAEARRLEETKQL